MGEDERNRTPLTPPRTKLIVVGVTDMRFASKNPPPKVPVDEVTVFLRKSDGTRIDPDQKLQSDDLPTVFGHFNDMAPGTYTAHAFRDDASGPVRLIAKSETVVLGKQKKIGVDLELELAPALILEEASFVDDHAVLVPTPEQKAFIQEIPGSAERLIKSDWGDGVKASSKPFKPEWKSSRAVQRLGKDQGNWHPASYSVEKRGDPPVKAKLAVKIRVEAKASTTRTLEKLLIHAPGLHPAGARDAFHFEDNVPHALTDGRLITAILQAKDTLPDQVIELNPQLELRGEVFGVPITVERRLFNATVYVTLGKPRGQVEMHPTRNTTQPFPETGDEQSVTVKRLDWAVNAAKGATNDAKALFLLFQDIKNRDIHFFGPVSYPPKDEHGKVLKLISFKDSDPGLHHFLWISLHHQRIAHCADLAAAFRLAGRILGVGGAMDVRFLYPWPPWVKGDSTGKRRVLFVGGEPGQGSLQQYREGNVVCVFFDSFRHGNFFEGALRWLPSGPSEPNLYAIGERICDDHTGATTKEIDDRNASLFFQGKLNGVIDMSVGKYTLAMYDESTDKLRRPAFGFLKNNQQTLFKFHYLVDTFDPDDDRQVSGGTLPPKKKP